MDKKYKCKLPKCKVEEITSLDDAKEKAGWGITAFNLPKTWESTQGEGVVIAVLDTGVDLDHPDLVNNLLPGMNFVEQGRPPEDKNSHGSHCAGILVAEKNEIGMVGVAPKAKVMPIKVLDKNGSGNMVNVALGIKWAVDHGADIISMSLGCPNPLQQVRKAIQYAESKGVTVFCAAGNAGITKEIMYPASYPETIGISAIDENFDRASFTCTGPDLDFMAPGVSIFSTIPDNWYACMSGSSMAAPFVVGVAALALSYVRKKNLKVKLTCANDYRELLKKYCTPIKNENFGGKKFYQGFGIINPNDMMTWLESQTPDV